MFSRNSDKEAARASDSAQSSATPPRPTLRGTSPTTTAPAAGVSVIGSDLTIVGSGLRIIAQQPLQVDGEIQGDVLGTRVTIGTSGKVTGLVNAEQVHVNGTVNGTIKGLDVILSSTSVVEGDIYHQTITLEQGAAFEGRSRRPADQSELRPQLSSTSTNSGPSPGVANGVSSDTSDIAAVSGSEPS